MRSRPLGRCGLVVSEVGFGTWPLSGAAYGPVGEDDARAALARALELGCTFFDAADVYGAGRSERLLGDALGARRSGVTLATKAGRASADGFEPARLRAALEGSLARLATGWVDLFQLHDAPAAAIGDARVHRLMDELKREGLIRAAGVSVATPDDGALAVRSGAWDAVQVVVNVFFPEAARELLPLAAERGVGIVVKEPLDHGMLAGRHGADARFGAGDLRAHAPREEIAWRARGAERLRVLTEGTGRTSAQAALRWLLDLPGVSTVIPGIKSAAQAEEALAASEVPALTAAERERVDRLRAEEWY
jgi:aryl-alcohol dehydrogenase-like predicted oxidoreductase